MSDPNKSQSAYAEDEAVSIIKLSADDVRES